MHFINILKYILCLLLFYQKTNIKVFYATCVSLPYAFEFYPFSCNEAFHNVHTVQHTNISV